MKAFFNFVSADITRQSEMSTIVEEPSNAAETSSANTTRASRRSERSMGDKSFAPKSPRRSVQPEPMAQLEPEPVPAPRDTFAQIPDGIVDNPADPTTIEPTIDPNLDLDGPPSVAPFSVPPPSNAPPSVAPSMAPVSAADNSFSHHSVEFRRFGVQQESVLKRDKCIMLCFEYSLWPFLIDL